MSMDARNTEDNILYVKMFGKFSIAWNGKSLAGGSRRKDTQYAYLMQLLLYYRNEGISRSALEEILFENREVNNVHHAFRTVLYNARKYLRDCGLPDFEYFPRRRNLMFWTQQIPVRMDTEEFLELIALAEETEEKRERLEYLLEACCLYEGEFLADQGGMLWVAEEARKFRARFAACVDEAAGILREIGDFAELEKLGRFAAYVQPLSDWEPLTMEALIAQGRTEEARKLYDSTVEYYYREEGLEPSERMVYMLDQLGVNFNFGYAALENIQKSLEESNQDQQGGYYCPYTVFRGIYRMVSRMMERGGQSVYLMLCTLVDLKGNPMRDGAVLDRLSPRLQEAICCSVRHGDAVSQCGKGQYVVLLVNTNRENCELVQNRINRNFIQGRQRTGVEYYVSSVICSADRGR